ncbi:MAG: hypothetical protein ACRCTW_06060 [Lactococcus garvieae]
MLCYFIFQNRSNVQVGVDLSPMQLATIRLYDHKPWRTTPPASGSTTISAIMKDKERIR